MTIRILKWSNGCLKYTSKSNLKTTEKYHDTRSDENKIYENIEFGFGFCAIILFLGNHSVDFFGFMLNHVNLLKWCIYTL